MRVRAAVVAVSVATFVGVGVARGPESDALPHVCVYAAVNVTGVTGTTVVHNDNCPALPPPATGDPCPGGAEVHHADSNAGVSHDVMVCVTGL